jgi:hypothetical protein
LTNHSPATINHPQQAPSERMRSTFLLPKK